MMNRTAELEKTGTKRRLENVFDECENISDMSSLNNSSKKLNRSNQLETNESKKELNMFEKNMFEADYKSFLIKITTLEHSLECSNNEKKNLDTQIEIIKKKHNEELNALQEVKHDLEVALKNCKSNEKLINGELQHLQNRADELERIQLPEKDKEIQKLKKQLENIDDEKQSVVSKLEKDLNDLKFEIELKSNELSKFETDISKSTLIQNELNLKLETERNEKCLLQNQLKDLEIENSKLKDNSSNLSKYIDQSVKIDSLERENRKLNSELEYLKKNEQENYLFQEELQSKANQIERYEKRIVSIEVENKKLNEEIIQLKESKITENTSKTYEQFKENLNELEQELEKKRKEIELLHQELKANKKAFIEKEDYVDELHKKLARSNTERNCYKKMIEEFDNEKSSSDATKYLEKKIEQLEIIINHYKKSSQSEPTELKLCNNTSFRLEELDNKSVAIQVNLSAEIYKNYEETIQKLRDEIDELNQRCNFLESNKENSSNVKSEFEILNSQQEDHKENSNSNSTGQIQDLEVLLKKKTEKYDLLVKEFERKSSEILRFLRVLIGFKINFEDKTIKLTNLRNRENILVFRMKLDQSLSLIETEYAKNFENFSDKYIKEYNSIPAFLTAILLEEKGLKINLERK